MASTTNTGTTEFYTAKAGRIAIFNGENYADFERTCKAALVIVGAWGFIDGQEDPAAARTADALKRRAEGIKLIFNSVGQSFQAGIREHMKAQNPRDMWLEIAKYNRAKDAVYVGEITKQFRTTIFDPTKSTIREFVNDLEWFRTTLSASDRPLSEEDLCEQLLSGLPDDPKWTNAKNWCLRDKLDFKESITLLQSNKPFSRPAAATTTQTKSAAVVHHRGSSNRGRSSSRARGGRNSSRGISRRGSYRRYRGSSSKSQHRTYLRRSGPDEPRKAKYNECRFCYKEGHYFEDCLMLK